MKIQPMICRIMKITMVTKMRKAITRLMICRTMKIIMVTRMRKTILRLMTTVSANRFDL